MWRRIACLLLSAIALKAEVKVEVSFTPPNPSLSDLIRMEVTLVGPTAQIMLLRQPEIPPECVAITEIKASGDKLILTLDPLKPGPCRIPAFQTRCLHESNSGCVMQSAETIIPVHTVVPAGAGTS